jgi:hypothetical protein
VSAAPILPQAPAIATFRRSELEQEAVALGVRFQTCAKDLKGLSRDLYLNYQAWLSRTDGLAGSIDGYAGWLDELDCGIPRTSLWRRLKVGFALKSGFNPEWSDEELIDAAQLFEHGDSRETINEAVAKGHAAKRAEAKRKAGSFQAPVSVSYQGDYQAALPILSDYYRVPAPDALGVLLSRVVSLKSSGRLADLLGERE